MPSFDTVCEPNLVEVKNAVDNTAKEIGTRFDFKFRARFGLEAKSAPSSLYDYYNPEARAVIAPAKFLITEK